MLDQTEKEVISSLAALLPNVSESEIDSDSDPFALGIDSITAMTFLMELQQRFNIVFDPDEINFENFQSVSGITSMIEEKLS